MERVFDDLSRTTREYVGRVVARLERPPSAVEFAMKFVGRNVPFVCANATSDWRAHETWRSLDGLGEAFGGMDTLVEVNATPDGRGDAVVRMADGGAAFVEPAREQVSLRALFESFGATAGDVVHYLSTQNDNLRTDDALRGLLEDCGGERGVGFADSAFGCAPDAINLWIGDDRSVTSYHRDFYENLYTVVAGTKIFSLRPPCDFADMRFVDCAPARYALQRDASGRASWRVDVDACAPKVSWSAVDVDDVGNPIFGDDDELWYHNKIPREPAFEVEVHAGETLYLPAMWYHRVRQRGITIAVNSWYDMTFDDRFAARTCLESALPRRPDPTFG